MLVIESLKRNSTIMFFSNANIIIIIIIAIIIIVMIYFFSFNSKNPVILPISV